MNPSIARIVFLVLSIGFCFYISTRIRARYRTWQYRSELRVVATVLLLFFEMDKEGSQELKEVIVKTKERRLARLGTDNTATFPVIHRYLDDEYLGSELAAS